MTVGNAVESPLRVGAVVAIAADAGRCYVGRVEKLDEQEVVLADAWFVDTAEVLDAVMDSKAKLEKEGQKYKGVVSVNRRRILDVEAGPVLPAKEVK